MEQSKDKTPIGENKSTGKARTITIRFRGTTVTFTNYPVSFAAITMAWIGSVMILYLAMELILFMAGDSPTVLESLPNW